MTIRGELALGFGFSRNRQVGLPALVSEARDLCNFVETVYEMYEFKKSEINC